jgi:hypothetical protein
MKTKENHYWATQEQRWYDQWVESQKMVDELETAIRKVEDIALQHITDKTARDRIVEIVNHVWRGARS